MWQLGWVSFFTDTASETIYPLMPLFLTRVLGAGAMSLGVIEGVAEAVNSVLKIVSGWMTDRSGAPKRLVLAGYALSSFTRPLIAFVTSWVQVLGLRFVDRLGKGIRTSPRDAMLAQLCATRQTRPRLRLPPRDGSRGRGDWSAARVGLSVFFPKRTDRFSSWTLVPGIIVILVLLRVPEPARAAPLAHAPSAPAPGIRTISTRTLAPLAPSAPLHCQHL